MKQQINLTKSELQVLQVHLRDTIQDIQILKDTYSAFADHYWKLCDKENDKDSWNYESLKFQLNKKQKYSRKLKKLANIQGKIKKMISSSSGNSNGEFIDYMGVNCD